MASKVVFLVTVQALLIQMSLGQVLSLPYNSGNSYVDNTVVVNTGATSVGLASPVATLASANLSPVGLSSLSTGQGFLNLASVSGGGVLPVTSYSPIAPGGLTVLSENAIEGALVVNGELPFLSAVAFEGALNTDGAGAASCGCGTGSIGITSESYGSSLNSGLGGLGGVGYGLGGARGYGGLRF